VPIASNESAPPSKLLRPLTKRPLDAREADRLGGLLTGVSDPEMQERLKNLGAAIMQDGRGL
jgi:hypothetical protein